MDKIQITLLVVIAVLITASEIRHWFRYDCLFKLFCNQRQSLYDVIKEVKSLPENPTKEEVYKLYQNCADILKRPL